MPYSYPLYKKEVKEWLSPQITGPVLDVGAGSGSWADLLSEFELDAMEIHAPYIEEFGLDKKYHTVLNEDVTKYNFTGKYQWVIMGDVLEHLEISQALSILETFERLDIGTIVAVPYLYHQDACLDNPAEEHKQADLTPRIMMDRYPTLHPLVGDWVYGYYTNKIPYQEVQSPYNT